MHDERITQLVEASDLVTVSDYFSLVGVDEHGHVAFSIDTNRGQDGATFQAKQLYAVLHDERQGWVKIAGTGRYEHTHHDLLPIPDSKHFQFVGHPSTGLTITSAVSQLALSMDAVPPQIAFADRETVFVMGSAAAELAWGGRVMSGRVIYEYLVRTNFDLMTRRSFKGLGEFQRLYLLAGTTDDLYIQRSFMTLAASGMAPLLGFSVFDGNTQQLRHLHFAVARRTPALGLYRWPTAWQVSWQGGGGRSSAALQLRSRTRICNWVLAGFSMGIVSGSLSCHSRNLALYGLGEQFMMYRRGGVTSNNGWGLS